MPADTLISRVRREMTKRLLMTFNIASVKTLNYQITTTRKRRKLADALYFDVDDERLHHPQDTFQYLEKLKVYLLALAYAGIGAAQQPPKPPAEEARLGAVSTEFVEVPLDVVDAYHQRATRCAAQQSAGNRLTWLKKIDEQERSEWVGMFRNSQLTCLLYTSPSPRDKRQSRMPSSA